MRKITIILILILNVCLVQAQKSKVTSASNYLNAGKIDKAKEAIDQGIKHDKCVGWSKAYLIKGKVYQGIFESPLPAFKKLDTNSLATALEAYKKAHELDVKGKLKKSLKIQMSGLIVDFTNEAIKHFNNGKYSQALQSFESALEIEKMELLENQTTDTALIYNAGLAAQKAEKFDKAINFYKTTIDLKYGGAKVYNNLYKACKSNNNEQEAVKYLHKGFELYPNDAGMLVELINHYLYGGETHKAAEYLDKAIKMDPENSSFYAAKGSLYEKTKEYDKANEMFKKALEINPEDYISQYNLGLIKLNKAIAHHKKANEILEVKKYNEEIKIVYSEYEKVIPSLERVLEIKPGEKNAMLALKELYFKLRNEKPAYMEKYNKIKEKLESVE